MKNYSPWAKQRGPSISADVYGSIYGIRIAIEAPLRAGRGAIGNLTSIHGLWPGLAPPSPFLAASSTNDWHVAQSFQRTK